MRPFWGLIFKHCVSCLLCYVCNYSMSLHTPTALFVRFSRFEVMIDGVILSGERLAVDMISHLKSKSLGC